MILSKQSNNNNNNNNKYQILTKKACKYLFIISSNFSKRAISQEQTQIITRK